MQNSMGWQRPSWSTLSRSGTSASLKIRTHDGDTYLYCEPHHNLHIQTFCRDPIQQEVRVKAVPHQTQLAKEYFLDVGRPGEDHKGRRQPTERRDSPGTINRQPKGRVKKKNKWNFPLRKKNKTSWGWAVPSSAKLKIGLDVNFPPAGVSYPLAGS